jgi:alpha-L-fucosidase
MLQIHRRQFVSRGLLFLAATRLLGAAAAAAGSQEPIAAGPFEPSLHSLKQYQAPEWFRNAKFGIWAHWSPQCVPEQGDWYARNMYIQGSAQYDYHVAHYGHPSKFGYKDICRLWKAENWDPEGLIQLYKKAGAKYFVALANHHDGFDCWNSARQPWNSVNMGPKMDIIGTWARAARQHGLPFGVAAFSAQNWKWFNVSHDSDKKGPLRGVPYDGNLTKTNGAGQWWQGYDPHDLYDLPHANDDPPPTDYVLNYFHRTKDLIDQHRPDLVFFCDSGLPLGDTGVRLAAHLYNSSALWNHGKIEAVIINKDVPPDLRQALVWERLPNDEIGPSPWLMDICIGDWHYKRDITYKSAEDVVPYLVDTVSKNGNLLMNIPIRPDGAIDDREIAVLQEIADWMKVNGEAIFDTRPWKIFGEGPTRSPQVDFPYRDVQYTPEDIRFTSNAGVLYAIALSWPDNGTLLIKSLARHSPYSQGEITSVVLLGSDAKLEWTRDQNGLAIVLPKRKPCRYSYSFRILQGQAPGRALRS